MARSLRNPQRPAAVFAMAVFALALLMAPTAQALPNLCDFAGVSLGCDAIGAGLDAAGNAIGAVGSAAAEGIFEGLTHWVVDTATWLTGTIGDLIDHTTSPRVDAPWFLGSYRTMLAVAGLLAVPMLALGVIQAVIRQDPQMLVRQVVAHIPAAFLLAAAAVGVTGALVAITDELSRVITTSVATGPGGGMLKQVASAYRSAFDSTGGGSVPLFGVFVGAIVLVIAGFAVWLEMIARDAAIYVALLFVPLAFVAMIWPATSRYARRLVEILIALIVSKLAVVAILTLATQALTTPDPEAPGGGRFEVLIAGTALLVMAAWAPFAVMRFIPGVQGAMGQLMLARTATAGTAAIAGAAGGMAGVLGQAMNHSGSSGSGGNSGSGGSAGGAGSGSGGPTGGGGSSGRSTQRGGGGPGFGSGSGGSGFAASLAPVGSGPASGTASGGDGPGGAPPSPDGPPLSAGGAAAGGTSGSGGAPTVSPGGGFDQATPGSVSTGGPVNPPSDGTSAASNPRSGVPTTPSSPSELGTSPPARPVGGDLPTPGAAGPDITDTSTNGGIS